MISCYVWTYAVLHGPANALTPHIAAVLSEGTVFLMDGTPIDLRLGDLMCVRVDAEMAQIESAGYLNAIVKNIDGKMVTP